MNLHCNRKKKSTKKIAFYPYKVNVVTNECRNQMLILESNSEDWN